MANFTQSRQATVLRGGVSGVSGGIASGRVVTTGSSNLGASYPMSSRTATVSGATVSGAVSGATVPARTVVSGARTVGATYAAPAAYTSRPLASAPFSTSVRSVGAAPVISSNVISSGVPVSRNVISRAAPMVSSGIVGARTYSQPMPARVIGTQLASGYSGSAAVVRAAAASSEPSIFDDVPVAAADPILSLATRFKEDQNPNKVNLGIGAYRSEDGKPWPLPSVLQGQLLVCQDPNEDKEYVPIDGKPEHKAPVQALMFSDEEIASQRIATAQSISGTGALQIIGQFCANFLNCNVVHVPKPTWGNHTAIFKRAGMEVKNYTYYHPATRGFDFEGMMQAVDQMQPGEAILLHACAQNPTGVDPTPEQWQVIVEAVAQRQLIPILDNAYQGYASGDLGKDGYSLQLFEAAGLEYLVAQSFAKNFGLYGERIGYIHVRCATPEYKDAVLSQLKILIRQAYSSPPRHGAAVVHKVLTVPELRDQWLAELEFMSNRILQMRDLLRQCLEARGTPGTWNHITDQIGMFSFTGLTEPQVARMVDEFSIYMTKDGRISVAGLNPGNVDYVAECIDIVVREA